MLGSKDPVLDAVRKSGAERLVLDDMNTVGVAYAEAMMYAQVMELAVKIAAPALLAPLDDEDAARGEVDRGRQRSLYEAVRTLHRILPRDIGVTAGFDLRLNDARTRRNGLAHDFWLAAVPRVFAGDVDIVMDELALAREGFEKVLAELIESVLRAALAVRDIDDAAMNAVVTWLTSALLSGDLRGLDLFDDGDEVIRRIAALADGGDIAAP